SIQTMNRYGNDLQFRFENRPFDAFGNVNQQEKSQHHADNRLSDARHLRRAHLAGNGVDIVRRSSNRFGNRRAEREHLKHRLQDFIENLKCFVVERITDEREHNGGRQKPEKELIMPLFNTTNVMEMAGQEYATMFSIDKGLEVSFTLEKDIKDAKLRYITTGHGGWGNGDEFVPKKNSISLDGKETFSFVPWRQDCGSYRLSNPASGNFETGLSSSDLSRSNWCPGTVTNPNFIDLGDLKAGKHTIKVSIPMGKPEGGSSSAWNVSGVLIGKE
ncbi:MAG: hypothetical protein EOP55_21550, partial [Sphingobacteriales bacterium]